MPSAVRENVKEQAEAELDFRSVEDFAKGELLGTGSFCDVLLCTDRVSSKQYAMKIVPKRRSELDQACIMEAHCLRRLERSQLVINMYWDIDTPLQWVGILELCSGGELWAKVQHCGCVAEGESAWYASQMVEALAVVHTAGIVHRDLKCENFLVSEGLKLKLIDFGTARDNTHPEVSPMLLGPQYEHHVGSPNFMSPEAIHGKANDRRSDLWSLGCCIYQLITGAPPFNAPTAFLAMQKAQEGDLWLPSVGLSAEESDLIRQLTKVKPDARLGAQSGQTRRVLHHPLLRTPAARPPDDRALLTLALRLVGRAAAQEVAAAIAAEAAAAAGEEDLEFEGAEGPMGTLAGALQPQVQKPGAALARLLEEFPPLVAAACSEASPGNASAEGDASAVAKEAPAIVSFAPQGQGVASEEAVMLALLEAVRGTCAEVAATPQAFSRKLAGRIQEAAGIPSFVESRIHRFAEMAERQLADAREQATAGDDSSSDVAGEDKGAEELAVASEASPDETAQGPRSGGQRDSTELPTSPPPLSTSISEKLAHRGIADEALSSGGDGAFGDSLEDAGEPSNTVASTAGEGGTPSTATGSTGGPKGDALDEAAPSAVRSDADLQEVGEAGAGGAPSKEADRSDRLGGGATGAAHAETVPPRRRRCCPSRRR